MNEIDVETVSKFPESKKHKYPLVFLHGMFEGSWVWEEHFLGYFVEKGFECYAINLKGHNGRPENIRFLSINDYIDDLSTVIDSLNDKPIVIAHSMGGFIVQKYLEENPLPFVIAIAPVSSHGLISPTLRTLLNRPLRLIQAILTLNLQSIMNDRAYIKRLLYTPDMDDELFEKFYHNSHNESFRAFLEMILKGIKYKKIQSPLEFLAFENDNAIQASAVKKAAKKYNKEAKVFKAFGHHPMLEENWKEVADYVLDKISDFES